MILVAGSANLDFVVRAQHIPAPGETVLGRDFETFPGGKGANQAIACARAGGVPTHMLLALGQDAFAPAIEESLRGAGVAMHTVRATDQPSGTAFICVSDDGENAITVAPGANHTLRPAHLAEHIPNLADFSHVLMQLETPVDTVTAYATAARQAGVTVALNAAPALVLPAKLLAEIDILIVNEGELATVAQHSGSVAACLAHIKTPCVVVTLGHRGCIARVRDDFLVQTAYSVTPVDTTAAGDTFCGAFIAALSQGATFQNAMQTACAAGALACTVLGAQASIPSARAIQNFIASQATHTSMTSEVVMQKSAELRSYCGLVG